MATFENLAMKVTVISRSQAVICSWTELVKRLMETTNAKPYQSTIDHALKQIEAGLEKFCIAHSWQLSDEALIGELTRLHNIQLGNNRFARLVALLPELQQTLYEHGFGGVNQ